MSDWGYFYGHDISVGFKLVGLVWFGPLMNAQHATAATAAELCTAVKYKCSEASDRIGYANLPRGMHNWPKCSRQSNRTMALWLCIHLVRFDKARECRGPRNLEGRIASPTTKCLFL